MDTLIILVIGIILGVIIYKGYRYFMKKLAIKELKEQLKNLNYIATHSDNQEEIQNSIEMAGKIGEALKKLEQ